VPGVQSVALTNNLPHRRVGAIRPIVVERRDEPREVQYAVVSPDYFEVLAMPVGRGRPLRDSDTRESPAVAVVDCAMADDLWPDQDPLGRRFRFDEGDHWITVVGVSAGVRGAGLRVDPAPGFHIPYSQRPEDAVEVAVGRDMALLVHLRSGAGSNHGQLLRRAVWDVDPEQPVPAIRALDAILDESTRAERFQALLVGTFAVLALVLALVGIYGVVAQVVGERRHELGLRKALGATNADLVGDVLAWGLRLTAIGLAAGMLGVLVFARLLTGVLHGVRPTDPATLAGATATVLLATLAACLVPALRAARADPRVTLTGQ
jgi:putative ABC transport system permease protein